MSIFDQSKIQDELFKQGPGPEHPAGTFDGHVIKVDITKTKSNHRTLLVTVKTEEGTVRNSINLDHPNCAAISQKTIGQILASYTNPPAQLETLEQAVDAMVGLPVRVHIKHKGLNESGYMQYGLYFNELKPESKVEFKAGTPELRVEY